MGAEAKSILIVDDDEAFRGLLEQAFRKEGFEVRVADDGSTAVIAIRERTPHLIVTDLMMAGVGGLELIRGLAQGEYADVPVLVITAHPLESATQAKLMRESKVVEVVTKPPSVPALIATIHRVLGTSPAARTLSVDEMRQQLAAAVVDNKLKLDLDVLVVDDSETARLHLVSLLEDEKCRCKEAADGKHALDLLKSYKPDIMILDFNMPKLDGFGLLRLMQGDPNLSEIPIIVLTGKTMNDAMRNEIEMESNVERVFSKPPDMTGIREVLRQLALEKRKGMLGNP